ncbi:aminoacylase-1-like isoform X2 [Leptopilina boulardi]|uniref:aminoacylase-1-like isoform X2 n=1 Tax=Leptopilina boulardi TaxID=63433 RepID=UPI0021F55934|nr:aminoacylase-1-like isoform X2 [Leptopilina boulardi]
MEKNHSKEDALDLTALKNLVDYLQIPSVHPNVNYDDCVSFLKRQAQSLNLTANVFKLHPIKPIVIITWEGKKPDKPSILINGHMDVVPVNAKEWKYPPFEAKIDKNGNIYARGAQDMKSNTIQYIEAIRRLKLKGIRLERTIHLSLMPDEETGGELGMKSFVESKHFKDLNIGFALDEGFPASENKYHVTYGERTLFEIWIHCPGKSGHGSNLSPNTAGEKLQIVIDRFLEFRKTEKKKFDDSGRMDNVTSINLTMLKGGVQVNVVPDMLSVAFDIRVSPFVNFTQFIGMIEGWLREAGSGVNYTVIDKGTQIEVTKLDSSNIYWLAFKQACDENSVKIETLIMPAATDSRYLRALGIPALGFTPLSNTTVTAHAHDEYINKNEFFKGIKILEQILLKVANV